MASLWALLLLGMVAAERHYLFTAPKISNAGESEKMCLTLFNVPETGQLTLTLKDEDDQQIGHHSQRVSGVAGGSQHTCFDVKIPDEQQRSAKLDLVVTFPPETNYSIHGERRLRIETGRSDGSEEYLFVQTDKYLYKPGQLVRFRVFSVNFDLRPIRQPFPLIHIETPLKTRMAQWADETGQKGLTQLELQLSDKAPLGEWKIHVQTSSGKKQKKAFKVEEYVVPKFEVEVRGSPYFLASDEEVVWRVCGTYTYRKGQPVQGNATIYVSPYPHWKAHWLSQPMQLIQSQHQKHTGGDDCAEFRLGVATLGLKGGVIFVPNIEVRAELTDDATDVTHGDSKMFHVLYTNLKLTTDDRHDKYFKPGLPFIDRIMLKQPDDTPSAGVLVQLCYRAERERTPFASYERSKIPMDNICLNLTSDSAGIVAFHIPPQDQGVPEINIEATLPVAAASTHRWMTADHLSYWVRGWYSSSGAFLQLSRKDVVKFSCGTSADIPVLFTASLGSQLELFYQVTARGDILLSKSVPVAFDEAVDLQAAGLVGVTAIGPPSAGASPAGVVTLSIPVTQSMSSGFKVLVYMVVAGEVIADSQTYEAVPCLENPVTLRWSPDRARPQQEVQLTVEAAPGSLCGLDVVDKSVHLLGTENKISLSNFFDRLKKLNLPDYPRYGRRDHVDSYVYCKDKYGVPPQYFGLPPPPVPSVPDLPGPPGRPPAAAAGTRKRSISPWFMFEYDWEANHVDSLTAFDTRSLLVLSDYAIETRTCTLVQVPRRFDSERVDSSEAGVPWPISGGPTDPPAPSEVPETVRTYFPETWLFDLHTVGEDGTVTLNQEVPDTITEWVGGAVCTSDTAGLGIAAPATFTSFKSFFVTYTLPYSVKRGETLVLKVSVHNYNQHDLPIKLTLVAPDEFDTLTAPVVTSCVPAGASEVVPYRLRHSTIGNFNITVVAEVHPDFPSTCGPETIDHFSDAVTRPVLVEPEGFKREVINSRLICNTHGADLSGDRADLDVTWSLHLPADLVPGSERAHIVVAGDLLVPSIDNLESLIRRPDGYGEHNMILFTPSIYVMKYLTAVGELSKEIKQRLINNMRSGYHGELTYRRDDKSYAAFGNGDLSGSMWLTGFVVKSFGDAKQFIFIDENDLKASVDWIESQQTEDGCFPSVGRVLRKDMQGGVASGGQQALTAFITIALQQSSVQLQDNTLPDAFRCLHQDSIPDLYTLTLRSYAHALAGHTEQAQAGLAQLKSRATRDAARGLVYWQNSASEENNALSVEMGAYTILTMDVLWKAGDWQHLSDALSAVRWINKQRNSHGGWVSTQDTVLALEALAVFSASLRSPSQANLTLHLSDGYGLNDVISVTHDNWLLVQTRDVTRLPGQVRVRAEGTGCGLVQTVLKYNVHSASPSEALSIAVQPKPKPAQQQCLQHTIEMCVSYQKDGETNMAVVEVEMVSGFIPNKGSLKALKEDTELDLKRWEINNNKVVFYFDSLDRKQRCFEMVVQREHEVKDAKAAVATVYDYYQTEFALSTSYALDVYCMTVPFRLSEFEGK